MEKYIIGKPKMEKWLVELENVLENENIIFLSDKDLVFLVNQKLVEKDKITDRTFENWKAGKFHQDDLTGKKFMQCIQIALVKQKQMLSQRMLEDTSGQWQRFAWIMERKFSEWNLKHISENINRNEQATTIQITAANDNQRLLIDNIINAEFEVIETKKIELKESNDDNIKEDEFDF